MTHRGVGFATAWPFLAPTVHPQPRRTPTYGTPAFLPSICSWKFRLFDNPEAPEANEFFQKEFGVDGWDTVQVCT